MTENRGKDLRDFLAEGGDLFDLLDKSQKITEADLPPSAWKKNDATATRKENASPARSVEPGTRLQCKDRGNWGTVVSDNGRTCTMHFVSPEGAEATQELDKSQLVDAEGKSLVESADVQMLSILTLRELAAAHPVLRPYVIGDLLRVGETMNIVAAPKAEKSWLVGGLTLSKVSGTNWLEKFPCEPGRVLVLDAELHPEVIAHRFSAVADALQIEAGYDEFIDIAPLRGKGLRLTQPGAVHPVH